MTLSRPPVPLPNHPSVHPWVTRVTAANPGPFTGDGTNTWLVGREALAVIDPGPDDPGHTDAILAAAAGRPITHILITHAHRDHVDGLPRLRRATGAPVAGFRRDRLGSSDDGAGHHDAVGRDIALDIRLADGLRLTAGDVVLEALHTPGHAPDHLCFALDGEDLIFTGDHVMGWSTSVVAPPEGHMGAYLASLERLLTRAESLYLPGHGAAVVEGPRTTRAYLLHRQMREQAVLEALRSGASTCAAIAERVYAGLDRAIWGAAVLSVQAHVELLAEKGLVACSVPLSPGAPLALAR